MSAVYTMHRHLFKIIVVGDTGVGKSCMLLRFADGDFADKHVSTIGVDFKVKTLKHNDEDIKLILWDTAGQERFRTITSSYYRGAHGVIIVYDVTDRTSFESVRRWQQDVERYAGSEVKQMLVGNKCDLQTRTAVSHAEAQELADSFGMSFLETSARSAQNIEHAFGSLVGKMLPTVAAPASGEGRLRLPDALPMPSSRCCS